MKKCTSIFCAGVIIAAMLLSGASYAASADEITLKATVDKKTVVIGERVRFTVEIDARRGTEVELPKFADNMIGGFEIKDSGSSMRDRWFGWRRYTKWYAITAYETGTKAIPEIEIKYRGKGQKKSQSKKTQPIDIKIVSLLPSDREAADIKDIKGPYSIRNPYWGIMSLAIAFIFFLLITIIIYKRLERYVPVKLPHETALEELESIRASFLQGGSSKDYYVGISDCIRRYIEHVFKVKAPEMTTQEFLDLMRVSPSLSEGQKELLKEFLNACDMVKFAKYAPTRPEAETVYVKAKGFVEETKEAIIDVRV